MITISNQRVPYPPCSGISSLLMASDTAESPAFAAASILCAKHHQAPSASLSILQQSQSSVKYAPVHGGWCDVSSYGNNTICTFGHIFATHIVLSTGKKLKPNIFMGHILVIISIYIITCKVKSLIYREIGWVRFFPLESLWHL